MPLKPGIERAQLVEHGANTEELGDDGVVLDALTRRLAHEVVRKIHTVDEEQMILALRVYDR